MAAEVLFQSSFAEPIRAYETCWLDAPLLT
jgi:hypothetical protein